MFSAGHTPSPYFEPVLQEPEIIGNTRLPYSKKAIPQIYLNMILVTSSACAISFVRNAYLTKTTAPFGCIPSGLYADISCSKLHITNLRKFDAARTAMSAPSP